MSEKQRRIESVRRSIVDVEQPLRRYFESFAALRPSEVTPEIFAELQDTAFTLQEAVRREMQAMFDLLQLLAQESTPQEQLTALQTHVELERIRAARIVAKCELSKARWEAMKAERASASNRRKWFNR